MPFRTFATYKENVTVDVKQKHTERVLLKKYKDKLQIEDSLIVCNTFQTGRIGEENLLRFWPHVYLTEITRFYRDVINKEDLIQKIECEYSISKVKHINILQINLFKKCL